MIETKEADLVTAVLLYAMRCLAEGDQHALRAMRFGPQEIEALRELTLGDLYRIGTLQAHCLAIRLDRAVFWPMLANLRAARESEELQRDLVEADAPLEMMRSLFGVGAREYTRLRRMFALAPAIGRPAEPDEETSRRLWIALSRRLPSDPTESIDPAYYLAVHKESGAPMRAIWALAQRWLEYGDIFGNADNASTEPAPARPERAAVPSRAPGGGTP